ncbi:amidase signature enzyme [Teratosphaeria destructans]|uniref:Amidase signature enzyme n=1 Tax=Teratosphaeria destructans TaxID=418781 RepID=A0A9W7SVW3_9PEZI|nr:amidase signature enzyme [Teratosphaeria destructans]
MRYQVSCTAADSQQLHHHVHRSPRNRRTNLHDRDLRALAAANNWSIDPGSLNESAFLLFANSFDATCQAIANLPEYQDPRLKPQVVESTERSYYHPDQEENPLNAWAQRTTLKLPHAKGKLSGRTIAFKDNVSIAGLPLGLGCSPALLKGDEHPISTIDAPIVSRVLAAGGTVKGTATCENLSMFPLSFTADSGIVRNAWNPDYATGGSSSGSAVAVSVGDVLESRNRGKDRSSHPLGEAADMAVGGDQGGSIRLPAAYSGVYGLKPTHGLVPYTGIASLNPLIDHTGPMTRSIDDAALLLSVIAGYDGIDPRATPETPLPSRVPEYLSDLQAWVSSKQEAGTWTPSSAAQGLRIGVLKQSFEVPGLDPRIAATVRKAIERFGALGAEVKDVSIPLHAHGAAIWTVAARPQMPGSLANQPPALLSHPLPLLDPKATDQEFYETLAHRNPAVLNVFINVAHLQQKYGPALVRKAHMHVWELRAAYDAALEDCDVLITPLNPTVAPQHPASTVETEGNPRGESERVMDLFEPAVGNAVNTCPFNVTGHPAMSVPVGWGKVKEEEEESVRLPVAMQVVAKRFGEGAIFRAVKAWEVGGHWTES